MKFNINSFCKVMVLLTLSSTAFATDRLVPDPYPTVQAGITAAANGDRVVVSQGTYYENINSEGKSITLISTDPNDPNVVAGTVIDGNDLGTVVTFPDDANAVCVLAGFTITGGNSPGDGGGILCLNGTITVNKCVITDNVAAGSGGGIASEWADVTLAGCTFNQNTAYASGTFSGGGAIFSRNGILTLTGCRFTENVAASGNGGGIYAFNRESTLADCTFTSNSAALEGGGVAADHNNVTLTKCTFIGNSAEDGGGLNVSHWGATATNCTFSGNSATERGGAVRCFNLYTGGGELVFRNCTFSSNVAGDSGGAVCNQWDGDIEMTNCIAWANSATEGPQVALERDGTLTVSYSSLQGGLLDIYAPDADVDWLTGNIDSDPCFADPDAGDCHLQSTAGRWDPNQQTWVTDGNSSLCIDAGNPGCPPADEPTPNGDRINMGAYGGTSEASKSPPNWAVLADLTNDRVVDYDDMRVFVSFWLKAGPCVPADLTHDQFANILDFAVFAADWAWEK
jgi:predicted outer membrane repeat protein